jgi:hypothetical protein
MAVGVALSLLSLFLYIIPKRFASIYCLFIIIFFPTLSILINYPSMPIIACFVFGLLIRYPLKQEEIPVDLFAKIWKFISPNMFNHLGAAFVFANFD